jgi:hypothetical protein
MAVHQGCLKKATQTPNAGVDIPFFSKNGQRLGGMPEAIRIVYTSFIGLVFLTTWKGCPQISQATLLAMESHFSKQAVCIKPTDPEHLQGEMSFP